MLLLRLLAATLLAPAALAQEPAFPRWCAGFEGRPNVVLREVFGRWRPAHQDDVRALAVSADGRFALSAGSRPGLAYWDLASGEPVHVLEELAHEASSAAFAPDGERAATTVAGKLYLWDLVRGVPYARRTFPRALESCAWSAEGGEVLCADEAGVLHAVDAALPEGQGVAVVAAQHRGLARGEPGAGQPAGVAADVLARGPPGLVHHRVATRGHRGQGGGRLVDVEGVRDGGGEPGARDRVAGAEPARIEGRARGGITITAEQEAAQLGGGVALGGGGEADLQGILATAPDQGGAQRGEGERGAAQHETIVGDGAAAVDAPRIDRRTVDGGAYARRTRVRDKSSESQRPPYPSPGRWLGLGRPTTLRRAWGRGPEAWEGREVRAVVRTSSGVMQR